MQSMPAAPQPVPVGEGVGVTGLDFLYQGI